jgi:heme-degrading monooxygenase HmoA
MILEIATIDVIPGQEGGYQAAFKKAAKIIAKKKGYISHELQRCIEDPSRFLVMIQWETLEDHTIGFRESPEFKEWRALIGPFFNSPPDVKHYEIV